MPLYCIHDANPSKVYVFPEDTPNGGTPSGSDVVVFNTTSNIQNPDAITISGLEVVILDTSNRSVNFFPVDAGHNTTPTRRLWYRIPTGVARPQGAVASGSDLYIADNKLTGADDIVIIPLGVGSGQTATETRRFRLPSVLDNIHGLDLDGNDLYIINVDITDGTDTGVFIVPADTADGTEATISRRFTFPVAIDSPIGVVKVGTDLYIADPIDREIYVVSADTANNTQATISRQFNMPSGLLLAKGLTYYAPPPPTVTISTDDTDIREGESVDFEIVFSDSVTGFTASDVSVTGGTRGTLTGSGTDYTLSVTAGSGAGTIVISINEDVVSPGNASASESFTRTAKPTATLTFDATSVIGSQSVVATITWSESVTNFAVGDLSVNAGMLSNFSGSGSAYTVDVTAPSSGSGTLTLTLAADAVDAGNASVTGSVSYAQFSVRWANVPTSEVDETFTAQLNFSHPISGLVGSDLLLRRISGNDSNGNFTNLTDNQVTVSEVSGTNNYLLSFDLSGTYDGVYQLRLRRNTVSSGSGTYPSSSLSSANVTINTDPEPEPTVSITFDPTTVRGGRVTEATIEWSASVTGFVVSDVSVNVGTLSNFSGSGSTYTVDVTAPATGTGTLTLTVAEDAVDAGNAETTGDVAYQPLPTAAVAFTPTSVRNGRTTQASIVWDESVTDFDMSDVSVDVGTLSNFAGTGTTYTVDITAPATGSGNITLTIAEDAVDAGNAEATVTVAYSALPTATVTFDPASVRNGRATEATIEWSESVTGFSLADVSVDTGALSNFAGTGDTYTVDVTAPATGTGNITLTLRADAVDVGNAEATAVVSYSPLPTVAITFDRANVIVGDAVTATLEFSESVTGLAIGDLSLDFGTLSNLSGSGTTWTVDLTAPSTGSGNMTLTVAVDAVDQGLAASEASVAYAPFSVSWVSVPTGTVNTTFSVQLNFSHPISGLINSDLIMRRIRGNDSNGNFVRPTSGEVTITQITDTNNYTVAFDLSGTYDGVYQLRLRPGMVTSGSGTYPTSAVNTANITIDSDHVDAGAATATLSFPESSIRGSRKTTATIEWSENVTDFAVGDLSVNAGTLSNFSGSGTTYTVDVTAPTTGSGTITLTLAANAVSAGNAAVTGSVSYSPLPTVAITYSPTSVRGGRKSTATLVWSESVTGFGLADLSVDVGTLANFSGTGDTYTVDVTAPATGTGSIVLTVREDAVNEENAETTASLPYTPLPTATITYDATSLRGGRTAEASIVWSESVTGFNLADVSVNVGTLSNFSGTGDTYTVDVTAPVTGSGSIELTIREDAAVEGNAVTSGSLPYSALPTATITFDPVSVRGGRKTTATIEWSESVTGFAVGDVSVNVGTLANFSGSGDTYTVAVTAPVTGSGSISLIVAADAVSEGNAQTSASVTYSPLPTVAITFDRMVVRGGRVSVATLVWSENVTGFTIADVSVDVGTLGNFSGSGDTYTVDVTAPVTGSGNITLTVRGDAVSVGNVATSESVAYLPLPTVAITFGVSEVVPGASVIASIVWSESVSGFAVSDISVSGTGATKGALTGSGTTYELMISTATSGTGNIVVRIAADAVNEGNAVRQESLAYVVPGALIVEITSGYASRYVVPIGADAPEDLNDFAVRFEWSQAVSGFDIDDVSVSGGSLQAFVAFSDSYYEAVVRPPASGAGTLTVGVRANAVVGGNRLTQASFSYSSAVRSTVVFDWGAALSLLANEQSNTPVGLTVEASRYRILGIDASYAASIYALGSDGRRLTAEDITGVVGVGRTNRYIDANLSLVNGLWFVNWHVQDSSNLRRDIFYTYGSRRGSGIWDEFRASAYGIDSDAFGLAGQAEAKNAAYSADINRWGLFFPSRANGRVYARSFRGAQRNISGISVATDAMAASEPIVALGDRVYFGRASIGAYKAVSDSGALPVVAEKLNVAPTVESDIDVYGSGVFYTRPTANTNLYRIDVSRYRSPAVRPRIVPQFVVEGESLDLKHFVSGAERILFDSGYDTPAYLSIDSNQNLDVASGRVSDDTCVLVKLRAFSRSGETPFRFYLVVLKRKTPVWKDVRVLPMDDGETVNLLDLVPNAKRISWRSGFRVPLGYTLSAGQLTVANQRSESPVAVELTAFNDFGRSDIFLDVQTRIPGGLVSSDVYDYRVLIAGIDVTEDLLEVSSVHHSLDVINPNEFVSDDASFILSSDRGKYDGRVSGNFWEQSGLNPNGYLSEVEVWVDILDGGSVQSKLLFSGVIIEVQSSINGVSAVVNCVDRTYAIKQMPVGAVGLAKYSALHRVRETYEGVYAPDASLLPILQSSASVVSGSDAVPVETYPNTPEAVTGGLACFVKGDTVLTRGGFLPDDPVLKFKTPYQKRDIAVLMREVSEASGFFNTKVAINRATPAAEKHIYSRGNVAFNVEQTKPTRTVVDWVHARASDIFYLLLSHPSAHVQDLLVSYSPVSDSYETLKTFDFGIQVSQLVTTDYDTFYVIATTASGFDRVESPEPANHDASVFDNFDSSRETSATRILRYVVSPDRVTDFVAAGGAYPVQVGLHYMGGFENARHIRLREGVFSEGRGTFRIHSGMLYYRFATWNTFGVARVPVGGGSPVAIVSADRDDYFNTLNFGFDIADNGDVYMVYAEGEVEQSTLKVEQYDASAGTSAVVFQHSVDLADLTTIDAAGGAYLGCHEVKCFNDRLYCVLPIQRVYVNDSDVVHRDIRKSAGAVLAITVPYPRPRVLKSYDYVQLSCRSLTVHANALYFAEYPDASTHYQPSNSDLDGWDPNALCNIVSPNKAWLQRVVGIDGVESVVTPWYEGQAFNATAVPMLSDGNKLHAVVRYADKYEISAVDAGAARSENEQWVTFGADVPFYVERVPSGTLHDALVGLAKLGNARFDIQGSRLRFVDVDPYEALCASGVSASAGVLSYKDANKAFPQSGYVLVGKEILRYSGRGARQLTGLTRGVAGTEATAHSAGDRVMFLDKVIQPASLFDDPYKDVNIRIDTNKFYNIVRDSENTAAAVDADSVMRLGRRALVNNLALSDHQIAWRRYINAKTLSRLKDIKSVVRVRMRAAYYLEIGDVVVFAYGGEILIPIEIIDIQHTQGSSTDAQSETHIIGREVKGVSRVSFGGATVSDKTFTQYQQITPFVLPAAENPKSSYVYRLEGLIPGLSFDPRTRIVSGMSVGYQSALGVRYSVTDADNPTWQDELTFDVTVSRVSLSFVSGVSDRTFDVDTAITAVTLPAATGGVGAKRYFVSDLPAGLRFNASTRQLTGTPTGSQGSVSVSYWAVDSVGNTVTAVFRISVRGILEWSALVTGTLPITSGTAEDFLVPAAVGGVAPYTYSMTGLQYGLSFDPSTRRITGTPSLASGDVYFVVRLTVRDSRGTVITQGWQYHLYSS